MAREAAKIRGNIIEQLKSSNSASLVLAVAKFDFYQHAIPTINEMNSALSGLNLVAVRTDKDILLEPNELELGPETLTQEDLTFIYEIYIHGLRKRKEKNA
jgi:hypothetical protein